MGIIRQLNGLRFVAVALVLLQHFAPPLGRRISGGYIGVEMFFVISGFLITRILVTSQGSFGKAWTVFEGRRALRIFPIYYLTLILLLISGDALTGKYIWYCLSYTYNYAMVYFDIQENILIHLWSLCVEEQFYLIWPLLVLPLRKYPGALKAVIMLIILTCWAQMLFHLFPANVPYNQVGLFPRAYALALGGLGAILWQAKTIPERWLEHKAVEIWMMAVLAASAFLPDNSTGTPAAVKYLTVPVCSLYFILKTVHSGFSIRRIDLFLKHPFIVYTGTISYGIYLYHLPMSVFVTKYLFNPYIWNRIDFNQLGAFSWVKDYPWIVKFPLYASISVVLAHLSYQYLERPILKFKDKWFLYTRKDPSPINGTRPR